jgi:membrane protein DedA with SNARE-associated domain
MCSILELFAVGIALLGYVLAACLAFVEHNHHSWAYAILVLAAMLDVAVAAVRIRRELNKKTE